MSLNIFSIPFVEFIGVIDYAHWENLCPLVYYLLSVTSISDFFFGMHCDYLRTLYQLHQFLADIILFIDFICLSGHDCLTHQCFSVPVTSLFISFI